MKLMKVALAVMCVAASCAGSGEETSQDQATQVDASPSCKDECVMGAGNCEGDVLQKCAFQRDGCLHWVLDKPCEDGTQCMMGQCVCNPQCDGTYCGPGSDGCGGECQCMADKMCSTVQECCSGLENMEASCNKFMDAFCGRIVECCTGTDKCPSWTAAAQSCRDKWIEAGLDCSNFSKDTICIDHAPKCIEDVKSIQCKGIISNPLDTSIIPPSC